MAIFDNGMSPSTESAMIDEAKVPRSSFNMSRVTSFNGLFGALMPFDVMDTLPNEDYTIGYDVLALTRNPLMRRLQNGGTIYIHTFWMPKRDLWKGWDNFIDKGRSGTHVASIPKYYPAFRKGAMGLDHANTDLSTLTPFCPACYMGVPIVCFDKTMENLNYAYIPCGNGANKENVVNNGYGTDVNNTEKWGISALDLVMYNRIYRDEYANQNILMNNKYWFPDNEDDALILPYEIDSRYEGYVNTSDGGLYSVESDGSPVYDGESGVYIPDGTNESKNIKAYLNALHFRQFKGDYFTSANPFKDLIRGNQDSLNIDVEFNVENHLNNEVWHEFQEKELFLGDSGNNHGRFATLGMLVDVGNEGREESLGFTRLGENKTLQYFDNQTLWNNKAKNLLEKMYKSTVTAQKGLTLNAIRKAIVLEKFMQRNATTNGTYRELVGAQFGYKPNVHDRRPRYVGGCYQSLNFSEVVQTSATDGTDMLGKTASRGMSANSGYIGKFHSDDYGTLMSIMCIVPDVYYDNQGLDTRFTRTEQEQQYFPIYNNLEPQAILNKEIYISGNKEYDEDVFGYANRFEDMKSRRNIICGLGACGEKAVFDSQNFMRRTFNNNSKPALTQKFLTMSPANIDLKPFASVNEPPFDIIVGCNIDKVSPMPFKAEPADLGIKY